MPKDQIPNPLIKKIKKIILFSIISVSIIFGVIFLAFQLIFWDKIYPGLYIADINVSSLTKQEAQTKVKKTLEDRLNQTLILSYQDQKFELNLASFNLVSDSNIEEVTNYAFQYGRSKIYSKPTYLDLTLQTNSTILNDSLTSIDLAIDQPPIDSQIKIEALENINVTPSQDGFGLDHEALKLSLNSFVNKNQPPSPNLPTKVLYPSISYGEALQIKNTLDKIKLSPIKLVFEDKTWIVDLNTLLGILDLQNSQSNLLATDIFGTPLIIESVKTSQNTINNTKLSLNPEKSAAYFKKVAQDIDQEVQEPRFQFDGQRVSEFQAPIEGKKLNITLATAKLNQALSESQTAQITLPVDIISPQNKLSNELGIKELVGEGFSNFRGSIENRIFNLRLAANRVNGQLIAPNEEFSFNKAVGDISATTGYKQAYVIKSGKTVLDDGGGVCQVSTTVYRAALNAGLPITARTAHAYRVSYYEVNSPPGLDATIYQPSVDFKFKNDTGHHLLLQTQVDGQSLIVNLYGTKDGRAVNMTKPIITSQTAPQPELRQDDPTLPVGEVKQVEHAAYGAKVQFSRTVTRGGETLINETIYSNYRPWQAVYLVGTKPEGT